MVGIWLLLELSSSSQVTIRRLLCVCANWMYAPICCWSQVSPWAMVPSCMSSLRFGITMEMVGSVVKSVGKLLKGRLEVVGMFVKFTQGACFRA